MSSYLRNDSGKHHVSPNKHLDNGAERDAHVIELFFLSHISEMAVGKQQLMGTSTLLFFFVK